MKKIHKYSELNDYIGLLSQDEITDKLIDCFEDIRKEDERQRRSKLRNEANISIENAEYKGLVVYPHPSVEDVAVRNEDKREIVAAISSLTKVEAYRLILNVVYGYSTREIARIEGVYQPAVFKSIMSAKSKLKIILNNFVN